MALAVANISTNLIQDAVLVAPAASTVTNGLLINGSPWSKSIHNFRFSAFVA